VDVACRAVEEIVFALVKNQSLLSFECLKSLDDMLGAWLAADFEVIHNDQTVVTDLVAQGDSKGDFLGAGVDFLVLITWLWTMRYTTTWIQRRAAGALTSLACSLLLEWLLATARDHGLCLRGVCALTTVGLVCFYNKMKNVLVHLYTEDITRESDFLDGFTCDIFNLDFHCTSHLLPSLRDANHALIDGLMKR
jgi:hypothetical protein